MVQTSVQISPNLSKANYKKELRILQVELVKLQRHLIKNDLRLLVIFEGRDAAGKDGVIKRITEHLSPRETRVVALGKPSDREQRSWYFRRYIEHLPSTREMVLMNRSWYNRAGVERVMGFCSEDQYEEFMSSVTPFEEMLIGSGHQLIKYYLDISKTEQKKRLNARQNDPLKQWKSSPIDEAAVRHWDEYTTARNEMLRRTGGQSNPWFVVRADNKRAARLNVIRHLLSIVDCPDKQEHKTHPDSELVFQFKESCFRRGWLAG